MLPEDLEMLPPPAVPVGCSGWDFVPPVLLDILAMVPTHAVCRVIGRTAAKWEIFTSQGKCSRDVHNPQRQRWCSEPRTFHPCTKRSQARQRYGLGRSGQGNMLRC